jgi:hypothetical protein
MSAVIYVLFEERVQRETTNAVRRLSEGFDRLGVAQEHPAVRAGLLKFQKLAVEKYALEWLLLEARTRRTVRR